MTSKTKYIFVTGGVVSSLGKGITASSLKAQAIRHLQGRAEAEHDSNPTKLQAIN